MRSPFSGIPRAIRALRRSPSYTLAAALTLGLGMGATASIYTLVQRVVLDPLPYPHADRLLRLKNPVPGVSKGDEWNMSAAQFFYYRQHVAAFADLGAYNEGGANVTTAVEAQRAHRANVTAGMMRLLGASTVKGRLLDSTDDVPGAPAVAVLSYGFWKSHFGGDDAIVGQTLRVDDFPFEVVGVMKPDVELPPDRGQAVRTPVDFWTAMRLNPAGPFHNNHVIPVVARLTDHATIADAQRQIDPLIAALPAEFPKAYSDAFITRYGFRTQVYPLKTYVLGGMARSLWILFGAVALLFCIACANIANLFLARLESRRRDFAVRTALGARRGDIAREAFTEGMVLAGLGAVVATVIGVTSTRWLVLLAPPGIPRLDNVAVDWRVLAFTFAIALVVAAALAAVPTMQFQSSAGAGALGDGGRSMTSGVERSRIRGALVVAQVALALVLVVGSGLLLQSFRRLRAVDPGINPERVLTLEWYLPTQRYDSLSKVWAFHQAVLARIRSIPGVTAAGVSEELPLMTGFGCTVQGFEDQAVAQRLQDQNLTSCAGQAPTSPGYFEALGIPLIAGRYFTAADNDAPNTGAVIVTKAFAERFWPGENAIGKGVNPNGNTKPPFYHVVGVVGDLRGSALDEPPAMGIFYPIVAIPGTGRWYPSEMHLVVKTSRGEPLALVPAIRAAVNEVDPTIPLANAEAMRTVVDRTEGRLTFTMTLLGVAGLLALALSAVGLYGLIAYIVARRTNEIGIRIALGAQPGQVVRLVVRGALVLTLVGLAIGGVAAAATARVLKGLLYGVGPWDPAAYVGAVLVLALVAAIAGWIPSRRAARVDPAIALRAE